MFAHILTIIVVVLSLPSLARSQTWTSPDGFLSIMPPDENDFHSMPAPPAPFVGLWVSHDETMKFGVMKTEIPTNINLIQSAAEEGLAEEIGGTVTRLPTKTISGHEVWGMTAKSSSVEITQTMMRHDGSLYKLMAVTVGGKPDAAAVNRFIDSMSVVTSSSTIAETSRRLSAQPAQDIGGGVDIDKLSKTIGGAGALLGIGLLFYFLIRGRTKRQT